MEPHSSVDIGIVTVGVLKTRLHANDCAFSAAWLLQVLVRIVAKHTLLTDHVLVAHVGNLVWSISDLDTLDTLNSQRRGCYSSSW
jgi:hypothetical protein